VKKSYEEQRKRQSRRWYAHMHRAVGLGPLLGQDSSQFSFFFFFFFPFLEEKD